MDQMMSSMQARQAAYAAKRAQQAALAGRKTTPKAQPLLPEPTKEVWVGPAVVGELQPWVEGEAILAIGKKPIRLLMLDRATGKVRWEAPLEKDSLLDPVLLTDQVFYVTKEGQGVLLDAGTGKQRRVVALDTYNEFLISNRSGHSRILPPTVAEGRLIVATFGKGKISGKAEGKVQSFDLSTGEKIWELNIPGGPDLMPVVHGARIIVGGSGRVSALDASTGKVIWSGAVGKTDGSSELDFGFLEGDRLIVICEEVRIALDAATGKEIWREKVQNNGTSTLVGEGDRILHLESRGFFVASTWLVALDAASGKVAWELKTDKTQFPWVENGGVFCNHSNELLRLDLQNGKTIWNQRLPRQPNNPLLSSDAVFYVVHDETKESRQDFEIEQCVLKALDPMNGQLLWRYILATPYVRGFILADQKGLVYIGEGSRPVRVE